MIRLFVGIEIPHKLRQELARLQAGIPGAAWTAPDNFHLTLRFIGAVEQPVAEDIHDALIKVSAAMFPLALSGMGFFASGRRPRALWAGVAENPALEHLQARVERAVQHAGLPPEQRKFAPHVTLARAKNCALGDLHRFVAEHGDFRVSSFTVENFLLYESQSTDHGPVYRPLAAYPLIGAMLS